MSFAYSSGIALKRRRGLTDFVIRFITRPVRSGRRFCTIFPCTVVGTYDSNVTAVLRPSTTAR